MSDPQSRTTPIGCPTCGHPVQSIFDHLDIECEHDMTEDQIGALVDHHRRSDDSPSRRRSDDSGRLRAVIRAGAHHAGVHE